jgi:hypothetical protein
MKKRILKLLAGIVLLSNFSNFKGTALEPSALKNLNPQISKLTKMHSANSNKPNFKLLNTKKDNADSPFSGAKAGVDITRTIDLSKIQGANSRILGKDCVIQKIFTEIGPELTINEGTESGKKFYKTICIKGEFESQNSHEKNIVATFVFKVTFNYDKKTFIKIEKPDSDIVCNTESFEEFLNYKNKLFNNFNLISTYEVIPNISSKCNVATVSLINVLYKDHEVTGRKQINRRTHADVFCSINGEIGYNATKC